jgi:hypothetical protein
MRLGPTFERIDAQRFEERNRTEGSGLRYGRRRAKMYCTGMHRVSEKAREIS